MSKRVDKTKKNLMGSLWRKAVSDARVSKKSVNTAVDDTKENASMNPVASSAANAAGRRDQTSKSSIDRDGVLKHKLPKKPTIEQTIDKEVAKLSMEMAKTHSSEAAHEQQQSSGNSQNKEKPWPVMTSNAPGLANCSSLPVQKTIAPSPSFRIPQAASMITKSSRSSLVSKASAAWRSPRTPKRSVKALVEKEKSAPWPVMKSGESQVLGTSASLPVQSKSIQSRQIHQVSSMVVKPSKSSNNTNAAPRLLREVTIDARRPMSTSIVSKSSKDTASAVSKSKISDAKKVISPINNRYHAEKAIQKEEAASAVSAAAEVASVKKKATSRKKRQEQQKSALQQFREEEAAKAKEQARIKADIQMAATKRRQEDIKNGRGCLVDGWVCRPQLSLVSEDPENKVLTPRRSNATPRYAYGEKDGGFEANADKVEAKVAKGKSESNQGIHSTKSNKSMVKKSGSKSCDVIYTHKLPSKNKAQESTAVPPTSSKPLKTKIEAVSKAKENATPINKSQSESIVPDANDNPNNEKPKMSPRSKARMKRHNLASNSLTEKDVDDFPDSAAYPKYACFGSQAIIPDATSEESDMVGDEIVREASEAIGKALNIDPNEVKINIDRVVEDVAVSPKGLFGIKKWFDRGESERSNIMPNDSIFDGLESVAPIKSKKQSRGICSSALANLVCGTGEQVIVENDEGELRIRNIASVCTDDGEVIEVDEVLANDTLDYESDSDIGDETFDIDTDLEEDVAELGFDAYTPVKERTFESFEEDGSHYETGTDTEESDLDDIINEDECSVDSATDFDSVSATTSSSASESLEGSDDELSEMVSMDSRRSPHSRRHIPERICPTPIAVQSPISVNEASTCEESTRSPESGRKTPLVRITPSFSSFFKKTGLSTPRSNKTKLLASNYTPESEGLEDQKKSNFNTDMTSKIPAQVMCAVSVPEKAVKEDNKPIETAASLRSETSNGKVDDEPVAKICDDNETDLAADSMCETESKDEPQLSSTSGEAFTLNDVQRTRSSLSKASVKENHTATTLEESSTDNTGSAITEEISNESVITEQISSEADGIEVSFSSNSEKEQSDVSAQQEITSTPQMPVQDQHKEQSFAAEIEPNHEIGHEVEIEENVVTCISSAVHQDMNSVKSNGDGEEFDVGEGKDTPVDSSHDQDSIGSQKESRQDSFMPEVAADGCREGTDSAERVTDSEPKQEEQQNVETEHLKPSSTLDKDKTFSSKTSLDRSTSASSRVSDVLSSTSEGIEIKTPIKGIGHKRRKSRVRSFLMDKIQKPAYVRSE